MAGTLTDIIEIIAPDGAVAGQRVAVGIPVRNLDTVYDYRAIRLIVEVLHTNDRLLVLDEYTFIPSGEIYTFSGSFVMPNSDGIIWAYTYHTYPSWISDDIKFKAISLTESEVEECIGTISQKELEYNESRGAIPVYNVPQGQKGLVHIWGRNDMSTNQKLGIYWIVRGPPGYPDGPILEEYYGWQTFSTGPGQEHEFIGGRFNLDEVGLYDIRCGLAMNPDNPIYVDVYYGDLCTIVEVLSEPSFQNFAISEYVKR